MSKNQKILIIRLSALGDVAMTLPVVYSAARQHPETEFYMLTRPFFAKLYINPPANLHIIEADLKGRYKGVKGLLRLIRHLESYDFTAVADLHNVLRSWIIDTAMRLKGKRVAMVDKKRSARRTSSMRLGQESFIQRYVQVFDRLGLPVTLDFRSVYALGEAESPVQIEHPAVGIAPFARYTNKTYPTSKMKVVVEALARNGVNVYLFGARGHETALLDSWASQIDRCTSLAGKMDITDELKAMAAMDVMVSMDSANQHLASIVDTKVLSIWGSTAPGCGFYPYRQDPNSAICLNLDCQPCTVAGSKECIKGHLACMHGITPAMIAERVMEMLAETLTNNRPYV